MRTLGSFTQQGTIMMRADSNIFSKWPIARCSLLLAASLALAACGGGGSGVGGGSGNSDAGSAGLPGDGATPTLSITGVSRVIANTLYAYQADLSNATPTGFDWAWGDGSANSTSNPAPKVWRSVGSMNMQLTVATSASSLTASQAMVVADPISAGGTHTCAVLPDSTAACWGNNAYGQLGIAGGGKLSTPLTVAGLTDVASMTTGVQHSCALSTSGTVKCWGLNAQGQLGIGSTADQIEPTPVLGLTDVIALKAHSSLTTCALKSNGLVSCWGSNAYGGIGDGAVSTAIRTTPVQVPNLSEVVSLAKGSAHTCALIDDGTVKCWGLNDYGQLGDGTKLNRSLATAVLDITDAVSISAGESHTCALLANGSVKCWGRNSDGQLGLGNVIDQLTPTLVPGLLAVVALELGSYHSCALKANASVVCWGYNSAGQLGDGTTASRNVPTAVTGLANVAALTAGAVHTCALQTDGNLVCWGWNGDGQLGDATLTAKSNFTPVSGGPAFWK
jgi:alpha-tubulin suppressor-like RCC1 family protein